MQSRNQFARILVSISEPIEYQRAVDWRDHRSLGNIQIKKAFSLTSRISNFMSHVEFVKSGSDNVHQASFLSMSLKM